MQNTRRAGKVMDQIYFLFSSVPIWSCGSDGVQLETSAVAGSDSNERINKRT